MVTYMVTYMVTMVTCMVTYMVTMVTCMVTMVTYMVTMVTYMVTMVTYQIVNWGHDVTLPLDGMFMSTLTVKNAQIADEKVYSIILTSSNKKPILATATLSTTSKTTLLSTPNTTDNGQCVPSLTV